MNIFEFLYYLGYSAKKLYSLRNQKQLPCKVISIGNLTVGGTGKTPATIAVAEEAKRRGFSPVVLTRGYKGRAKGPCFVTKGDGPLLTMDEAGDEPVLMGERLRGIPIVKGSNRYKSGIFAIDEIRRNKTELNYYARSPMLFIIDDGFQHWRLHRDIDVILIDANNPFGNRMMLPFGRLREPVSSLARADIIVLTKLGRTEDDENPPLTPFTPRRTSSKGRIKDTHNSKFDDLVKEIRQYNSKCPIFFAEHVPVSCRLLSGEEKPLSWASGKKFFGFCALGSPESFKNTVESIGAELVGFKTYRDHYRYRYTDMLRIKEEAEKCGAEWIVTTEKDIIKIRNLDFPEDILIIGIKFSIGIDFYEAIFSF